MSSYANPKGLADSVDRAAAILRAAADEVHVIDEPFVPLLGVNFAGRVAVFVSGLPWLRIVAVLVTVLCLLAAWVKYNHGKLVARFDAFVTKKVLTKMRAKLACDVQIDAVRVRPGATPTTATATVEGFRMGNPPTGAFNAPFLVSMERVTVRCNPLSLAGIRGRGNFVVGWNLGEVEQIAVHGAVVYIDEVFDPGKGKKIRNFQGIRRQTAAQLADEINREEEALVAAREEKRLAEEAAAVLKEKNIEVKETSFFSSVTDTFSSAQAEIDKQLKEVTAQAAALPGNISTGIQSAGADVTNKLNALITLLERVNQKPPEETEAEKRKKRKLVLSVEHLTFTEWNINILAVSDKAFKFKSWQLEKFTGKVGMLARECAAGLLNEIIKDFQQEILDSLTKDISAVGEGLLSIGGSVVGGVAEGGNMIVGGVGAIGQGIADTGQAIGKGLSDTGEAVADGLNKTTSAVTGFFGFSSVPEEPKKEEAAAKKDS